MPRRVRVPGRLTRSRILPSAAGELIVGFLVPPVMAHFENDDPNTTSLSPGMLIVCALYASLPVYALLSLLARDGSP